MNEKNVSFLLVFFFFPFTPKTRVCKTLFSTKKSDLYLSREREKREETEKNTKRRKEKGEKKERKRIYQRTRHDTKLVSTAFTDDRSPLAA